MMDYLLKRKPKKLGYLLSGFPRLSETFILNEMLELERQGVRPMVFSLKRGQDLQTHEEYRAFSLPVVYVPEKLDSRFWVNTFWATLFLFFKAPARYFFVTTEFLFSGKKERYFSLLKSYFRWIWLCSQIQKYNVNWLHAHFAHDPTTMAYWVSQLLHCPYSFTAHAKDIYCYSQKWLQRKIHHAQFVATCTKNNKLYFEQLSNNGTPIYCVHHGIDLLKFQSSSPQRDGKPFILSVGRLVEKKGFPILLQACSLLREQEIDFECQIVGQGPLHDSLQRQITALNLNDSVKLRGALPHDKLLPLYRQADVFVLPSRVLENGDRDGIPNVILEAMAMEIPVISTRVSAIPEAVEHGSCGLLVEENNPREVAEAIKKIFVSRELSRQMGKRGREKILRVFELKTNVNAIRELLVS
ncbi:MAG: glycosyltransferase family 4 protein [bacterium]